MKIQCPDLRGGGGGGGGGGARGGGAWRSLCQVIKSLIASKGYFLLEDANDKDLYAIIKAK